MPDHLIIARDLAHTDAPLLTPDMKLDEVVETFGPQGMEALPVVDPRAGDKLVGILRRDAVNAFYNKKLLERIAEP
jgi:CBS domain-containing protein